jgi:hypothetical protein
VWAFSDYVREARYVVTLLDHLGYKASLTTSGMMRRTWPSLRSRQPLKRGCSGGSARALGHYQTQGGQAMLDCRCRAVDILRIWGQVPRRLVG